MASKPETLIVKKIQTYLNSLGKGFFFKIHGGPMQMSGISDLLGLINGKFVAIEVKTPENKAGATKLQVRFIDKVINCGGIGFVANSVDEVKDYLTSHNIV